MEIDGKKHPCPDCRYCQQCSDERCRLCRPAKKARPKKLSIAEQIALFEKVNARGDSGGDLCRCGGASEALED